MTKHGSESGAAARKSLGCAPARKGAGCQAEASQWLPVLMISHIRGSDPGHVGQWLASHGYSFETRYPRYGEPLPETLENYAGVVVFGGPMSATDSEDYLAREIDWLDVPLREHKPLLGICLGAQLLAFKLGGEVRFQSEGFLEVGYHPIRATEEGSALMAWPEQVYHWHREGFTLPGDAVRLAQGAIFENQAYRYGDRAFGVQFHPEVTHSIMNRWTTLARQRLAMPGAKPWVNHVNDHLQYGLQVRRWIDEFLTLWINIGPDGCDPR